MEEQLKAGKEFYLSHDPFSLLNGTGSGYAREIEYLIDKDVKEFILVSESLWKAVW
ncbi:MAG: hypothetical protein WBA23_08105 [Tunicatimonas sp.]|uniref:hypothetical protein n=1 Tax=Tunicatimonas sp. TaxID=1940096 RepID=UPI003C72C928